MEFISLRSVFSILLIMTLALFPAPFAVARTAANASVNRMIKWPVETRLAESNSKTDEPRAESIRRYLDDIFGVPGFKASWYDNITDVEVAGDTATIKTNLSDGDEKIIPLCGVISGFIYSQLNVELGIRKLKILGSPGKVLVFRRSVMDDCPYKSSPNPGLQPPAR
jgi:hypothetical protein